MRLYQEVGNTLRELIAQGEYPIGERLPPERDIAEQFSVSRSVVREALIMLELEKLIDVRKGSGVYVVALPQSQRRAAVTDLDENTYGPFELLQARQLL
ncbi:MAG: GntR family transcriptional regulator, partial [Enterobacterales bacterium]|nr:GntR family transcriptional regulator [Enterobacterales bacterium]